MRQWLADRLVMNTSRLPRLVTSILVAVMLLATPISHTTMQGLHQSSKHLPSKPLVKNRTIWASATRSSSTTRSASRPHVAKQLSLLSPRTFLAGQGMAGDSLQLVFRPLRC
jgi:hypothetical protein